MLRILVGYTLAQVARDKREGGNTSRQGWGVAVLSRSWLLEEDVQSCHLPPPTIPAPGATFPAVGRRIAAFPAPATSEHPAEHHDPHGEQAVPSPSFSHLGP